VKTFLAIFLNISLLLHLNGQENKIYYNNIINELSLTEQEKPLIFLDFWATWCAPCISSMPHTIELQKQFNNKVTFVYLSNEPSYKIQKFLEKKNYHFHALIDNERKTEDAFKVQSIPNSFLLNPEGEIIWQGKPTEISLSLLQRFVKIYGNDKGNLHRFEYKKNEIEKTEKWNEFSCSKTNLFFYEDPQVENIFYQSGDEFFLSGNLKYIISFSYDYPLNHIEDLSFQKHFRFKAKVKDLELFKKIIRKYLKKKHSYQIHKKETEQEVYFITDNNDMEFLDSHIYNYERGDAQYIQNDISIKIDNATPLQVFLILNNITPFTFIYKGKNKKKYDWNFIYSPPEVLLQQLKEELNFNLEKKKRKVAVYEITSE